MIKIYLPLKADRTNEIYQKKRKYLPEKPLCNITVFHCFAYHEVGLFTRVDEKEPGESPPNLQVGNY